MAHRSCSSFLLCADKFFDCPCSFDLLIVSKNVLSLCILSFLISQWSVREEGRKTQHTISQNFLHMDAGSALRGGIGSWGWDLCLGVGSLLSVFLWFLAWLFCPHPVFVLENNSVISHFLTS